MPDQPQSSHSSRRIGFIIIAILLLIVIYVFLAAGGQATDPSLIQTPKSTSVDAAPSITNTPLSTETPTSSSTPQPTASPRPRITNTLPPLVTAGVNQLTSEAETEGTMEAAGVRATETAEAAESGDSPTDEPVTEPEETEIPLTQPPASKTSTRIPATRIPPTQAAPTQLPQPTIIADASIQIRDRVSGEIFGDGRISLYAPDVVLPGQSVRVELELNLANLYITPTPAGAITVFPVPTRITATPPTHNSLGTPLPSPSPRIPIHEESGVQFYQRMGASLRCPPESFAGCDTERSQSQAKLVTTTTTRYSWLLTQEEAVLGVQNLEVELWAVFNNLDGELEYVTQWQHPFSIEIVTEARSDSRLWTVFGVLLVAAVMLTGVVGVVVYRRSRPPQALRFGADKKKPKVFISYRRQPSWSLARSVATSLERRGADVFLDVDDINEARFSEILQKAVEDADYFVPILTPETLDSKWVRREIELAIRLKKTIIPLTTNGFDFYAADLPEDLQELSSHNAITVTPEFFEEAIDRLATRFLKLGDEK